MKSCMSKGGAIGGGVERKGKTQGYTINATKKSTLGKPNRNAASRPDSNKPKMENRGGGARGSGIETKGKIRFRYA
jgi:hypothetical protein